MKEWQLIRLNFGRNPTHFGGAGVGMEGVGMEGVSERVRSDTLFSAWMSAYNRLFGQQEIENLLNQFPQQPEDNQPPPLTISSTFIYRCEKDNYLYYLPKPLAFPDNYPIGQDLAFVKKYKKLKYLPLALWEKWYQGSGFEEGDIGDNDYSQAFKEHLLPKVAIDRNTHHTNFYQIGFTQFQWEQKDEEIKSLSGLYFLLRFAPNLDAELETNLKLALDFLGEEGLGGERGNGAGQFQAEWLDLPPEWEKVVNYAESNCYTLISLFWDHSLPQELIKQYDFLDRGGYGLSPSGWRFLRKKVRMLSEGSILITQPTGKLANVTPNNFKKHSIYRSGISLSLPIAIPQSSLTKEGD